MSRWWVAYPVDGETYDKQFIGSSFAGGVVVDGTCDHGESDEEQQLLLIVRYER